MTVPFRFCANLGFLFTEVPFVERFARAAAAGFRGVEFMSPYEFPAALIAEQLRAHDLELVLFNLPAGDWAAGDRGIACLPDRREDFRAGLDLALAYAGELGCRRLNCLAGIAAPGVGAATLQTTLVANLRVAAAACAASGVRLLVEAINSRVDMPGFWLDTPEKTMAAIAEVGDGNLGLQFDIYHAQIMGGDLARRLEACLPRVGHVQIADNPGRHEPGTGEIAYDYLFDRLAGWGYSGWIGCEYRPSARTEDCLGWMRRWR